MNSTPKLLCIPHFLTPQVVASNVRPAAGRNRGGGMHFACMHSLPRRITACAWAGKSSVRWERWGERGAFWLSSSQFTKNIRRETSNKMRGIAVPEEEEGISFPSTTASPIEVGNEPPSRKRDLGSVGNTAAQLLLDKVIIFAK